MSGRSSRSPWRRAAFGLALWMGVLAWMPATTPFACAADGSSSGTPTRVNLLEGWSAEIGFDLDARTADVRVFGASAERRRLTAPFRMSGDKAAILAEGADVAITFSSNDVENEWVRLAVMKGEAAIVLREELLYLGPGSESQRLHLFVPAEYITQGIRLKISAPPYQAVTVENDFYVHLDDIEISAAVERE